MRKPTINEILVAGISTIALSLLVGLRFDAVLAGGQGYVPHGSAQLVRSLQPEGCAASSVVKRGEYLETCDGQFTEYALGDVKIALDENTEVVLQDGRNGQVAITLIQGRIVVHGPVTVHVRQTDIGVRGTTTLVHYSWLYQLDISPIAGDFTVYREGTSTAYSSATSVDTAQPYDQTKTDVDFSLTSESVARFYTWALESS